MVHGDTLGLVQRQECSLEENFVLLLERQREAVDDAPENFEEFRDAVMTFGLIDEPEEYVVDRLSYERPVHHKLSINAVQDRLQIIPLSRIL